MKVELIGTNLKWQSNWKPDQRQKNIIADLELEPIIQAASNDDQLIATVFLQSLFDPIMVKADLADRQATAAFFSGTSSNCSKNLSNCSSCNC
ncbi:hypothetical protein [Liquorilactobacillus vini]|uniref:hypothetical protein n=1 Tax=Liquorilactobacillus vini TaxID=238015 RepID=UPI0002F11B21|nr:hypothetical protein [Liquorilactobacillus vini]